MVGYLSLVLRHAPSLISLPDATKVRSGKHRVIFGSQVRIKGLLHQGILVLIMCYLARLFACGLFVRIARCLTYEISLTAGRVDWNEHIFVKPPAWTNVQGVGKGNTVNK